MKKREKLAMQSEELKDKMKMLENEKQEEMLKRLKMQENIKHQLDKQMEETIEKRKEQDSEKEVDKQMRKIKNEYFKSIEREEKENEKKSKEELQQQIVKYLKSEEEIKRRQQQQEKFEMAKRNAYNTVKDILDRKIKTRKTIHDSELKKQGLKLFEKLVKELEAKQQIETEQVMKQAMEIEKRKREERLKLRKIKEELRKEREADRLRSEKEMKLRRAEAERNREREIKERMDRQECDKKWNETMKRKQKQRKLEVRLGYMEQWEENEEKREEEEKWRKCELVDLEKEGVINYCEYVLQNAKKYNRPLFPVLSAIKDVKLECGIIQRKKNIKHLKSSVPVLTSKVENKLSQMQ